MAIGEAQGPSDQAPADPAAAVPAEPPRPLRPVARAAIATLILVTLANFVALAVDLVQLDLVKGVANGERVSFSDLKASDDRVAASGLLQVGAYVVCAVAFLIWYGRAYRNVARLGATGLRWKQGWAIAYWFIPIATLFRPKQVMNDIWRGSDPDLPRQPVGWLGGRVPALMHWWWALWILSAFVNNILFRRSLEDAQTPDDFVSIAQTYVVWDVVDVIPAILAVLVVHTTTKRQEERRRRFGAGELPPPPPAPA